MALYSETINTNSKWMWSTITTGGISILFLAGAFWGLTTSMNKSASLFISQPSTYIQPITVTKPPSKTVAKTGSASLAQTQKVNRSAKRDSTYAKTPLTKLVRKTTPIVVKPQVTDNITLASRNTVSLDKKLEAKTNNDRSLTAAPQSKVSQKSLSKVQLASLNLNKPQAKIAPTPSKSLTSIDDPIGPFKIVDVNIKVKKGDTLLKILKQNGATSSEAAAIINKLKPHVRVNALDVGQPLTLKLDRRKNNSSIHPIKLILPLGYRATKPDAILKDRISVSYAPNNSLVIDLPANNLSTITMRPGKPLKAPKFTPAPPKALTNKATATLSQKIASIAKDNQTKANSGTSGTSRHAYYRARSWVKGSFKKTVAAQGVPRDVQSRLISVYNQAAKSKKVKSGDVLEVFYDQTESSSGKLQKLGKLLYVNFKANGKVYTYYRYGSQFYDGNGKSINATSSSGSSSGFMTAPVPGARMTSKFGMRRHPVYRRWKMHSGTDFAAPRGTPIYAAASGQVTIARWYGGAGRYVQIDHRNGYNSGYMHMTRFAKGMKKGRNVKKGQIIGYVGSTGTATGNHLHFEVRKNGKKVNPMNYIGRGNFVAATGKLSGSQLSKFKKEKARITNQLNKTSALEKIAKR